MNERMKERINERMKERIDDGGMYGMGAGSGCVKLKEDEFRM